MVVIENKGRNVQILGLSKGEIRLKPGINANVNETDWTEAKTNPIVRARIDAGTLKEITKTAGPLDLTKMKVADAVDLISKTMDIPTLSTWKDADKRSSVTGAIDAQIEAINAQARAAAAVPPAK